MDNTPEQQPNPGGTDLSQFDDPMPAGPIGSDHDIAKQIRRRSSPVTKIIAGLVVIGTAGVGVVMYQTHTANEAAEQAINQCGAHESGSPEMATCLRDQFATASDPGLQQRIVQNLVAMGDPEAGEVYVRALDVPGPTRRIAAEGLANLGPPGPPGAVDKLKAILPETAELERTRIVWALAVFADASAAEHILEEFTSGRLQDQVGDAFDPAVIVRALGPARLSSDELINHESEGVRMLTAQALAEAGTPEVVDPLARLLRGELARGDEERSPEVIREAAAGLGRTGDERAAAPLFELLQQHPTFRATVIGALGQSSGATEVAALVGQATDLGVKQELVTLLASMHDPRVADTLVGLLGNEDEDIRFSASVALAEIGDVRSVPVLVAFAGGEDEAMADQALNSIEALRTEDAASGLLQLLPPSACPAQLDADSPAGCFRRAAIMGAMGSTGSSAVARRIEMELETDDGPTAAVALAALNYDPTYRRLLDAVPMPRDVEMAATNAAERTVGNEETLRKRRGAIRAMGRYGRTDAATALMAVIEARDDYELRSMAASSLGQIADAEIMRTVIAKVQDESLSETIRGYYVRAIWQKPTPELNGALLDLVANTGVPTGVRRAAALAVGYSGDPGSDERLIALLQSEDRETRTSAAFAVVLGGSDAAANQLVITLGEDADTREILNQEVNSDNTDWFNQVTEQMVENGQIWRRVQVAKILSDGEGEEEGDKHYGFAWLKVLEVLKSGWNGLGGVEPYQIRAKIYEQLGSDDAARREMMADTIGQMQERGLLLRARDEGGTGAEEARNVLRAMNRRG